MKFSPSEVLQAAEAAGFKADMVEKVLHLLNLLSALNSHPFLKGKWALKGGTALNMFKADLPRLSVDIDLNYIGALDREEMLEERPRIEQAAQAVFSREGFIIKKVPDEHAGGKWRLSCQSFTGQSGNLEVDINFMFRQPQRLENSFNRGHGFRHGGIGKITHSHFTCSRDKGAGLSVRIRGATCKEMPGRPIRSTAIHGFRAGVFGSAA